MEVFWYYLLFYCIFFHEKINECNIYRPKCIDSGFFLLLLFFFVIVSRLKMRSVKSECSLHYSAKFSLHSNSFSKVSA